MTITKLILDSSGNFKTCVSPFCLISFVDEQKGTVPCQKTVILCRLTNTTVIFKMAIFNDIVFFIYDYYFITMHQDSAGCCLGEEECPAVWCLQWESGGSEDKCSYWLCQLCQVRTFFEKSCAAHTWPCLCFEHCNLADLILSVHWCGEIFLHLVCPCYQIVYFHQTCKVV